ncbi:MAG: hypothetical protein RR398_04525, partial [Clostridia bacterium]
GLNLGIVLAFFGNGASIRANEYLKPLSRPLLLFYRNGNFRHAHIDSFVLWLERDMEIDSTVINDSATFYCSRDQLVGISIPR